MKSWPRPLSSLWRQPHTGQMGLVSDGRSDLILAVRRMATEEDTCLLRGREGGRGRLETRLLQVEGALGMGGDESVCFWNWEEDERERIRLRGFRGGDGMYSSSVASPSLSRTPSWWDSASVIEEWEIFRRRRHRRKMLGCAMVEGGTPELRGGVTVLVREAPGSGTTSERRAGSEGELGGAERIKGASPTSFLGLKVNI